ncbi:MAG: DMT family transporter [Bacillota bacterium]|nr:DMT family transporter [Bacillota bacterium]
MKIPVEIKNRAQSIAPKAALLAAVLIWGTSFVAGKLAYTDIGPVLLAFFRFSVAFLVLFPALIRYRHIRSLPLIPIALIGFMGVTLFYSLQNIGLYYTSAANTGLIQGSIPVFTLLFSVYLLGERFTWLRSLGVLLSVLGVVMIVLITGNDHGGTNPLLGNILVLLSAAAWAFYTVKSKPLLKKIPQQVLVAASMFFGLVFLLPVLIIEMSIMDYAQISLSSWAVILYLGLFASGFAFLFWNYGLKHVDASEAGAYTNLAPVIGVVSAAFVLGEAINLIQIGGGVLVIIGVLMVSRTVKDR